MDIVGPAKGMVSLGVCHLASSWADSGLTVRHVTENAGIWLSNHPQAVM